ncbi:MAG: hypothetical protein JWP91_59 [Fibrobacteres bacterium]|nr:hypothetical protein [Fibrobacterota bacterium]
MGGRNLIMKKPLRPFVFRRSLSALRIVSVAIACSGFAALSVLSGCKSIDLGDATDTTQVIKDSAEVSVTNNITQDPQTITVFLFPPNALEFTNTSNGIRLGTVDTGATVFLKVPAGTWKLGYEDKAGNRVPMRDENSGGLEWLRAVFAKDGRYALILTTDGNRTLWTPNFETIPAIRP